MASQSHGFTFRVCGSFSGAGNHHEKRRHVNISVVHGNFLSFISFIHLHSSHGCLASCHKSCSIYRHWHVCAKLQPVATTNTSAVIFVSFEKLTVFVLKSFSSFSSIFVFVGVQWLQSVYPCTSACWGLVGMGPRYDLVYDFGHKKRSENWSWI